MSRKALARLKDSEAHPQEAAVLHTSVVDLCDKDRVVFAQLREGGRGAMREGGRASGSEAMAQRRGQ